MAQRKVHDVELQYLTVSFAKGKGLNAKGHVQTFDYKQTTLQEERLEPLLLYSLIHPAYAVHYLKTCAAATPLSISAFLREAWGEAAGEGKPLRIEIKPALMAAERGFVEWLKDIGVQCTATHNIKSISAQENAAQSSAYYSSYEKTSIDALNQKLIERHRWDIHGFGYSNYSMDALTQEAWCDREKHFVDAQPLKNDWDASCVTATVVKKPPQHLRLDPSDEYDQNTPYVPVDDLKKVLRMWPGGRARLFKQIGVNAKDIDFWLADKARLPPGVFPEFSERVGLNPSEFEEWEINGGTLLVAEPKSTPRAIRDIIDAVTKSDMDLAFEALEPLGADQLPVRVYLYRGFSVNTRLNMLLLERGSRAAQLLGDDRLSQTSGPVRVPQGVWDDIVSIADNCNYIDDPRKIINAFEILHHQWLNITGKMSRWQSM